MESTVDVEAVAVEVLNVDEKLELSKLEERIYQGFRSFHEAGRALAEIRDRRLYREAYSTFEAYCRERWQIDRTYGHRLIEAAVVIENLLSNGQQILPANERQTRPLTALPPEQQAEAWSRALEESDGKPTEPSVQRAADAVSGKSAGKSGSGGGSGGGGGAGASKKQPPDRFPVGSTQVVSDGEYEGQTVEVVKSDGATIHCKTQAGTIVPLMSAELESTEPEPDQKPAPLKSAAPPQAIELLSIELDIAKSRIEHLEGRIRRLVDFLASAIQYLPSKRLKQAARDLLRGAEPQADN